MALQIRVAELRGVRKQPVVVLPEPVLLARAGGRLGGRAGVRMVGQGIVTVDEPDAIAVGAEHLLDGRVGAQAVRALRSEEHTSELQSHSDLVCRLLLEKKKKIQ